MTWKVNGVVLMTPPKPKKKASFMQDPFNAELCESALYQFTGTEFWYRHRHFREYLYTDGVKFVADRARAYWLIDAILSHQTNAKVVREEFQEWTLAVTGKTAILTATDGNNNEIARQEIRHTDFPLEKIQLYLTNRVLLLPSEY